MSLDFSEPISAYEFLAVVIAVIALVSPFIRWFYNEKVKREKTDFLPSGMITLFFNRSGSYISLGGVFEAKNKAVTVKEISVRIVRNSDNATLPLRWSTFPSPKVKKVAGNMETAFETAHPFKVEKDSLFPVFVEFENANVNVNEEFSKLSMSVFGVAYAFAIQENMDYASAVERTQNTKEYHDAYLALNEYYFWKCDTYHLVMTAKYENATLEKEYTFIVSEEDANKLRANIDALLIDPIARRFMNFPAINTIRKEYN